MFDVKGPNADEFDGNEIVGGILFVSSGDAPEMFDAIEETFHEIALAVQPRRETETLLAVGPLGNICPDAPGRSRIADGGAVITFVAKEGGTLRNSLDQRFSLAGIVDLSAVSLRPTERPSASTRAWSLVVRPPRECLIP